MAMKSIAAQMYPDGLPGLLNMSEFSALLGVSRPTGNKIAKQHPDFLVRRGNTNMVAVGLYQKLTKDESARPMARMGD